MVYSVYILFSTLLNRYYIGHTHNLLQRVEQHNAGRTPSTKPGRPWNLVYHEIYPDKSSASRRELEIKKMKSRKYIENLITTAG
jgi:putative endonuclease